MGEVDPVQDELLGALEQLAQKTHVITRWADEMYEFVKNVPQSVSFLFLPWMYIDGDGDRGFRAIAGSEQVRPARRRERKARGTTAQRGCSGRVQRSDVRRDLHARHAVLPKGHR